MSKYQEKMKAFHIRQQFKLAKELLSEIESIQSITRYEGDVDNYMKLSRTTLHIGAKPTSRIKDLSERTEIYQWLSNLLKQVGFDNTTQILLFIGQFRGGFWVSITVTPSDKWLYDLWDKLTSYSLLIVSENHDGLLVVSECVEYYFEAFVFETTERMNQWST